MHDEGLNHTSSPAPGWQQRRGGVQFYFCCCPFALLLAPFFIAARLLHYGMLRLLGRPVASPWTRTHATSVHTPQEAA